MFVRKHRIQEGENTIGLAQGAQVLAVIEKGDGAVLYVTEPNGAADLPEQEAKFLAVSTDTEFDADETNSTYIGTVRKAGTFTWHLFRVA